MNTFFKICISTIIFSITTLLGGYGGHHYKLLTIFILYSAFSFSIFVTSKNFKERLIGSLILLFPPVVILGAVYLKELVNGSFTTTALSWPSSISYIIAYFIGWAIYKAKKSFRVLIVCVTLVTSIWIWLTGYEMWLNKLNTGTFTGKVSEQLGNFILYDDYDNQFINDDFKNKLVVFDFWFTGCGYCIKDMPRFEKLFIKYKRNKDILLYSVNIPIPSDTSGQAKQLIREYNFTFPLLYAPDTLIKTFKLRAFPTYIVIDNGSMILFRGNIEGIERLLSKYEMNK